MYIFQTSLCLSFKLLYVYLSNFFLSIFLTSFCLYFFLYVYISNFFLSVKFSVHLHAWLPVCLLFSLHDCLSSSISPFQPVRLSSRSVCSITSVCFYIYQSLWTPSVYLSFILFWLFVLCTFIYLSLYKYI